MLSAPQFCSQHDAVVSTLTTTMLSSADNHCAGGVGGAGGVGAGCVDAGGVGGAGVGGVGAGCVDGVGAGCVNGVGAGCVDGVGAGCVDAGCVVAQHEHATLITPLGSLVHAAQSPRYYSGQWCVLCGSIGVGSH
ncbi:hypothetical protein FHG87_011149 [Trinorchestia longiramus]|nr:hypothetical protein FHG87_011149 [Trinorchestia longiramus]